MDNLNSLGKLINSMPKVNFQDEVIANPLFAELAKEAKLQQFRQQDPGLTDATMQMLVMAQGPKAFSYLVPELTTMNRVSNAIKEKSPVRLTGIPRQKDLQNFSHSPESRDKVLWTLTGNGIKIAGVGDRIEE